MIDAQYNYECNGVDADAWYTSSLGYEGDDVYAVIEYAMAETARHDIGVSDMRYAVMMSNREGVSVMALLELQAVGGYVHTPEGASATVRDYVG